ncbi:hypothetical protein [Nitrospira sp. Nam74]
MNMSYCRFRNTLTDLRDCEEALEALFAGEVNPLSEEELRAARNLATVCQRIVDRIAEETNVPVEDLTESKMNSAIEDANHKATLPRNDA